MGRLTAVILALVVLALPALAQQKSSATLAYTAQRHVWIADLHVAGRLGRLSHARRICRIPSGERVGDISLSRDSRSIAFHTYRDEHLPGIWLVAAKPGAHPVRIDNGFEPEFSPTADILAYSRENASTTSGGSAVWLRDLHTGRTRILCAGAEGPHWCRDGKSIALVIDESRSQPSGNAIRVVDVATGALKPFKRVCVNAHTPRLSPDGRWIAWSPHLSRPKVNGIVSPVTGPEEGDIPLPEPGEPLLGWSPDSRCLLWPRYILDPQNDDMPKGEEIRVFRLADRKDWRIGRGDEACFLDASHLLYAHRDARRSLWFSSLDGRTQGLLLRHIEGTFCVRAARR